MAGNGMVNGCSPFGLANRQPFKIGKNVGSGRELFLPESLMIVDNPHSGFEGFPPSGEKGPNGIRKCLCDQIIDHLEFPPFVSVDIAGY